MRDAIMQRYIDMTREAIGRNAQFILWPESATPLPYEQDVGARRADPPAGARSARHDADRQRPGRAGADRVGRRKPPPSGLYNAAYLIQPDGSTAAVYRKIHLVPFGEYVPFSRLLFFVGPLVEAVSDFTPGTEATLLPVAGHQASTAICYEVIYSSLMRAFVTRRQRAADDDHQRRLVRLVVGGLPALGAGVAPGDRGRALPGARRQHRHQRLRRPLRPGAAALQHVPERGDGRGRPLHHGPHHLQPHRRRRRLAERRADARCARVTRRR